MTIDESPSVSSESNKEEDSLAWAREAYARLKEQQASKKVELQKTVKVSDVDQKETNKLVEESTLNQSQETLIDNSFEANKAPIHSILPENADSSENNTNDDLVLGEFDETLIKLLVKSAVILGCLFKSLYKNQPNMLPGNK